MSSFSTGCSAVAATDVQPPAHFAADRKRQNRLSALSSTTVVRGGTLCDSDTAGGMCRNGANGQRRLLLRYATRNMQDKRKAETRDFLQKNTSAWRCRTTQLRAQRAPELRPFDTTA